MLGFQPSSSGDPGTSLLAPRLAKQKHWVIDLANLGSTECLNGLQVPRTLTNCMQHCVCVCASRHVYVFF